MRPHHTILPAACALLATLAAPAPAVVAGETASAFERDRAAILAMAGEFEVTFSFQETVTLAEGYEAREPYLEHATETVKVVADEGSRIILQHILLDEDSGRIVKHWKQAWVYEDTDIYRFDGGMSWIVEKHDPADVAGTWSQRVSQVDDTPRYESFGRWEHQGGFSSWTSRETRRPLPRREHTKRDDYEVLQAINRHTITPWGWTHEQDNLKQVEPNGIALCREAGLNTYRRTDAVDFAAADEYWEKTREFWKQVSARWDRALERDGKLTLRDPGGASLNRRLSVLARQAAEGDLAAGEETARALDEIVTAFLVDQPTS